VRRRVPGQAENLRDRELARAQARLERGRGTPRWSWAEMARALTNKLLHDPARAVRKTDERRGPSPMPGAWPRSCCPGCDVDYHARANHEGQLLLNRLDIIAGALRGTLERNSAMPRVNQRSDRFRAYSKEYADLPRPLMLRRLAGGAADRLGKPAACSRTFRTVPRNGRVGISQYTTVWSS